MSTKYESALVKKERNPAPKGTAFVSSDILNRAKSLTDNRIVVTKDEMDKIEILAYDPVADQAEHNRKTMNLKRSETLRNKIKSIDEGKHAKGMKVSKRNKDLPTHVVNNIDEVKLIKSKKFEIMNADDNKKLQQEKIDRKRKQNLMEVKSDFQDELKLLTQIKERQVLERQKYEQRRAAYNVLTEQINANNLNRIKDTEEKEKEQRQMRLEQQRLLEDEARDREVQHENKERLREDLDAANQQMIAHKEHLVTQEKEEEEKVKQYLIEEAARNERLKAEAILMKKAKEEQQRKMLEKQEKATDFVSKLDELRMKRYQEEIERKERQKELEMEQKRQLQKEMLLEEGERQKEYKMQLMLGNIEEERTYYERQLAEKRAEDAKLRREHEMQAQQRLKNKDFVVNQIGTNKNKKKDEKLNNLMEEKKIIQENVYDINDKVISIKGDTVGGLGEKTKTCKKIIDRIGNKTSFF